MASICFFFLWHGPRHTSDVLRFCSRIIIFSQKSQVLGGGYRRTSSFARCCIPTRDEVTTQTVQMIVPFSRTFHAIDTSYSQVHRGENCPALFKVPVSTYLGPCFPFFADVLRQAYYYQTCVFRSCAWWSWTRPTRASSPCPRKTQKHIIADRTLECREFVSRYSTDYCCSASDWFDETVEFPCVFFVKVSYHGNGTIRAPPPCLEILVLCCDMI